MAIQDAPEVASHFNFTTILDTALFLLGGAAIAVTVTIIVAVTVLACTRTAISALAWLVSATSPSIPAVRRPVLRWVTCRTLTSVLLQLRSASFCRLLARGQSPSLTAWKSGRAAAVPAPRDGASPHAPRRHH